MYHMYVNRNIQTKKFSSFLDSSHAYNTLWWLSHLALLRKLFVEDNQIPGQHNKDNNVKHPENLAYKLSLFNQMVCTTQLLPIIIKICIAMFASIAILIRVCEYSLTCVTLTFNIMHDGHYTSITILHLFTLTTAQLRIQPTVITSTDFCFGVQLAVFTWCALAFFRKGC